MKGYQFNASMSFMGNVWEQFQVCMVSLFGNVLCACIVADLFQLHLQYPLPSELKP